MNPYIARWNGTKWTRQTAPLPAGGDGGRLAGVSCASASNCVAVGFYFSIEIAIEEVEVEEGVFEEVEVEVEVPEGTLVETWNGSKWAASSIGPGYLEDVSCPSSAGCMAVSSGGDAWLLAEAKWSEIEGPAPGGGAWFSGLRGVSCASLEACTISGEYVDTAYHLYLSEWDGAKWSLQTSLEPASTGIGTLWGISCPQAGACVAAGESEFMPIAEHSE
jgi:hypothetical protein